MVLRGASRGAGNKPGSSGGGSEVVYKMVGLLSRLPYAEPRDRIPGEEG